MTADWEVGTRTQLVLMTRLQNLHRWTRRRTCISRRNAQADDGLQGQAQQGRGPAQCRPAALDEFVRCAGQLQLSLGQREAAFLSSLAASVQ